MKTFSLGQLFSATTGWAMVEPIYDTAYDWANDNGIDNIAYYIGQLYPQISRTSLVTAMVSNCFSSYGEKFDNDSLWISQPGMLSVVDSLMVAVSRVTRYPRNLVMYSPAEVGGRIEPYFERDRRNAELGKLPEIYFPETKIALPGVRAINLQECQ